MLVLTRKADEEIIIDKNIVVKIVSLSDNSVKIGIEAPANINILRGEIFYKVKESTIKASLNSKESVSDLSNVKINKWRQK